MHTAVHKVRQMLDVGKTEMFTMTPAAPVASQAKASIAVASPSSL